MNNSVNQPLKAWKISGDTVPVLESLTVFRACYRSYSCLHLLFPSKESHLQYLDALGA